MRSSMKIRSREENVKNNVITDIPLAESAGKLKYVDPQSDIVKEAKLIGISFGD